MGGELCRLRIKPQEKYLEIPTLDADHVYQVSMQSQERRSLHKHFVTVLPLEPVNH